MQWHSSLKHCATSQKVTGSIPNEVTDIFHSLNPAGHTMALRSTQPQEKQVLTQHLSLKISSACGVNLNSRMLDIILYVVDKSDMPL
jgi:hypothetical protein